MTAVDKVLKARKLEEQKRREVDRAHKAFLRTLLDANEKHHVPGAELARQLGLSRSGVSQFLAEAKQL